MNSRDSAGDGAGLASGATPPAGRCIHLLTRCLPRGVNVVRFTCLLVALGLFIVMIYGRYGLFLRGSLAQIARACRTLLAVIQGGLGIVVSVETLLHVTQQSRGLLLFYAGYMTLHTVVSFARDR
jgi:hypothetical protein